MIVNGINYSVEQGERIKDSLTMELFIRLVIVYSVERDIFKKYDIAEYEGKKWLITIVHPVLEGNEYRIDLTLTELTYILEKSILLPCSFTNPNDYLIQQIEKLFYKVETLRVGETPRFRLSQTLTDFLLPQSFPAKPGEDFVYSERMTLREILDDMLSPYGIRCYVEDINNDFTDIVIGYLDLNQKSADIKPFNLFEEEEISDTTDIYADEFDIQVRNAQSKKRVTAKQEWQTLKPVDAVVTDNTNLKLIVDVGIEEIVSCIIKFVVTTIEYIIPGTEPAGDRIRRIENAVITIDITELFIEQELYDAMDITQQEQHIPYQRGSNVIGITDTYKALFFTYSKLSTYVNSKMLPPDASQPIKDYLEQNNISYESIQTVFGFPSTPSALQTNVLFQTVYNPYIDYHFKQSKDNQTANKKINSILNQTDRSVDIDRYAKSIRSLANLAGNPELVKTKEVKNVSELLNLGDRIENDYSVVSREIVKYDEVITCRYTFIQNYQATISARFSRERRLYNIPNEILVERNVLIKDNLLISSAPMSYENDSVLTNESLRMLVNSFDKNIVYTDFIERLYFTTIDREENIYPIDLGRFSLNLIGRAIGKSLIWQTKFGDNYSVGLSSGKRIIGGREVYLNPYVNDEGETETMEFALIKSNIETMAFSEQLAIGNSLPVIPVGGSAYPTKIFSKEPFDMPPLVLKKDRQETISFTYQLEAKGINIIVGDFLMQFMNLIASKETTPIYLWGSYSSVYNSGNTDRCKGSIIMVTPLIDLVNYRVYTDYPISLLKSWAIGTEDGRLLLAINNDFQNINSFYFGLKRN